MGQSNKRRVVQSKYGPEQRNRLRKLLDEGYSSSQIGAAFGISRNAVLGLRFRMGLSRKFVPRPPGEPYVRPPYKRKKKNGYFGKRAAVSVLPAPSGRDMPPAEQLLCFAQLTSGTCRWPDSGVMGFRSTFLFCGREVVPGRPYCAIHGLMARRSGAGREIVVEGLVS
jgi:hypothetical protein